MRLDAKTDVCVSEEHFVYVVDIIIGGHLNIQFGRNEKGKEIGMPEMRVWLTDKNDEDVPLDFSKPEEIAALIQEHVEIEDGN